MNCIEYFESLTQCIDRKNELEHEYYCNRLTYEEYKKSIENLERDFADYFKDLMDEMGYTKNKEEVYD